MKQNIKLSRYAVITIAVWATGLILLAVSYSLLYVPQLTQGKVAVYRLRKVQ